MEIEKEYVSSSNIEAVGYDDDSETLRIWFLNGSIYDYSGVGLLEYQSLRDAASVGSYLHRNIKGQYSYQKVG
ncbi:KTSC domain-containing protein [uncultured Imperialibacter sp.]|uniref:KTSC domain-containing protein n=1 Tax=uncultured Imperialibacter sp. TaxID=1672639 RepID=UPI0030DA6663|tara:strand:+ start:7855 stop:8073 length:219 start_codon:yes stop_codon:yes gene_type:complete